MYSIDIPESVYLMKNFNPVGNIIPHNWYTDPHFKFENGKTDIISILILSNILDWYSPELLQDEYGVERYHKKFKSDLFQRDYQGFANLFGFSKKQVRDSMTRLEEKGFIKRVFRTIETSYGVLQNNVLFIELNAEKILSLDKIPTAVKDI